MHLGECLISLNLISLGSLYAAFPVDDGCAFYFKLGGKDKMQNVVI